MARYSDPWIKCPSIAHGGDSRAALVRLSPSLEVRSVWSTDGVMGDEKTEGS